MNLAGRQPEAHFFTLVAWRGSSELAAYSVFKFSNLKVALFMALIFPGCEQAVSWLQTFRKTHLWLSDRQAAFSGEFSTYRN